MTQQLMTCLEVIEFLESYLSGELPPEAVARFNSHLAACPSCVAYTETYKATIRLTRHVHDCDAAEADVPVELVQAILAVRNKPA